MPHDVPSQAGERRSRTTAAVATVSALLLAITSVVVTSAAAQAAPTAATDTASPDRRGPIYLDARQPTHRRVADLLRRMTLDEKVGQMTQTERGAVAGTPSLIAEWQVGSVLSGGGSTPPVNEPAAWLEMVNAFQEQALTTRLQIPIIYGIDAVHGIAIVQGATISPHNIGLGATRDTRLVEEIGEATAEETRAIGVPWNFAPCLCVTLDERWGRSYESYGEDPGLVTALGTAVIDGLQGRGLSSDDSVLATPKHFAGDGHTVFDEETAQANEGLPPDQQAFTIDQGVTVTNWRDFLRIDVARYAHAIRREDVTSVMPSFSSVDFVEDAVGNEVRARVVRAALRLGRQPALVPLRLGPENPHLGAMTECGHPPGLTTRPCRHRR